VAVVVVLGAARVPASRTAQPATRGSTGGRPTSRRSAGDTGGTTTCAPGSSRSRSRMGPTRRSSRTASTHARQSRSAFDGYNRGQQWERTCAEVAKLRIARGARREAVSAVVGSDSRKLAAASL